MVDNLPPSLLQSTIDLLQPRPDVQRLAVVVDVRGGPLFSNLVDVTQALRETQANVGILFLEASEEVLVPGSSPPADRIHCRRMAPCSTRCAKKGCDCRNSGPERTWWWTPDEVGARPAPGDRCELPR